MYNIGKSILFIMLLFVSQLILYHFFLKPTIITWGASKKENMMPMVGDSKNLSTTSTRAILINAPKTEVWQWLMQLGADRSGFYSYDFIEQALGYKTRHPNLTQPKFKTLKVGDVVRGSIDEKSNLLPFNFPVLYVKPQTSLVLGNWGTFLLQQVNKQQTRLIIRTRVAKNSSFAQEFNNAIIIPFHFIMERRLLMGIKARAEAEKNAQLSNYKDILWFLGIVLSSILIVILVFIGRGITQRLIVPLILSTLWSCSLLLFKPIPVYSLGLLLTTCITIWCLIKTSKRR